MHLRSDGTTGVGDGYVPWFTFDDIKDQLYQAVETAPKCPESVSDATIASIDSFMGRIAGSISEPQSEPKSESDTMLDMVNGFFGQREGVRNMSPSGLIGRGGSMGYAPSPQGNNFNGRVSMGLNENGTFDMISGYKESATEPQLILG